MTMYTLDLTGPDQNGRGRVNRFGGLFPTVAAAVEFGKEAATRRLHFSPELLWVRDEDNNVVQQSKL